MLSRRAKWVFYALTGPMMWANGWLHRHVRHSRKKPLYVHLGPGQRNYIERWVNVDANMFTGRCDIWADLRNPLPFKTASVDAMYSHHMVEHLPNLDFHFNEVFRCLKPGGIYRVGGPNGDSAIAKFMEKDLSWFDNFPDNRESLGGRFENFIFCRQEHLTILTLSYLEELLLKAGFANIILRLPAKETGRPEIFYVCLSKESESDYKNSHTLIVEAEKPA